jgi:hypothetical protein
MGALPDKGRTRPSLGLTRERVGVDYSPDAGIHLGAHQSQAAAQPRGIRGLNGML